MEADILLLDNRNSICDKSFWIEAHTAYFACIRDCFLLQGLIKSKCETPDISSISAHNVKTYGIKYLQVTTDLDNILSS